jgi:DNA-binding transcriptional LysR family regulator
MASHVELHTAGREINHPKCLSLPDFTEPNTRQPKDLHAHDCIRYRFPSGAIYDWQFERDGEEISVEVSGPLTLDNQELMVEAALLGCGLAYIWDARVQGYLASERLRYAPAAESDNMRAKRGPRRARQGA